MTENIGKNLVGAYVRSVECCDTRQLSREQGQTLIGSLHAQKARP